MFVSSLIYPFTIYDLMTSFINFALQQAPELTNKLEDKRASLILILGVWQLGFTALVFIICIFFSHKIAGPLFKLQKYLSQVRDGTAPGELFFRDGDYFQELADDFNSTFKVILESYQKDFEPGQPPQVTKKQTAPISKPYNVQLSLYSLHPD